MKKLIVAATFVMAMIFADAANAQTRYRTPAKASHGQRITQGVRHGSLTRQEAQRLKLQRARIQGMKKMAKTDGVITPRERMIIRKSEQNNSYAIYKQKHDRERR